jgi:hypothetical protein
MPRLLVGYPLRGGVADATGRLDDARTVIVHCQSRSFDEMLHIEKSGARWNANTARA